MKELCIRGLVIVFFSGKASHQHLKHLWAGRKQWNQKTSLKYKALFGCTNWRECQYLFSFFSSMNHHEETNWSGKFMPIKNSSLESFFFLPLGDMLFPLFPFQGQISPASCSPRYAIVLGLLIRPCKTEPLCESHSVEHIFAQWFEKLLALSMVCGQSQETQHPKKLS